MASSFSASPSSSTVYLWLQSVHVHDSIMVSVSFFVCCVPLIAEAVQDCILFFLPACRGRHGKQSDRYSVMANEAQKRKENHYHWLQSLFKTHSRHCHIADSSVALMAQPAFMTLVIISSSLISLWLWSTQLPGRWKHFLLMCLLVCSLSLTSHCRACPRHCNASFFVC